VSTHCAWPLYCQHGLSLPWLGLGVGDAVTLGGSVVGSRVAGAEVAGGGGPGLGGVEEEGGNECTLAQYWWYRGASPMSHAQPKFCRHPARPLYLLHALMCAVVGLLVLVGAKV